MNLLANHVGENALPGLLAAGAGVVPMVVVLIRAHLSRLGRPFRRRPGS